MQKTKLKSNNFWSKSCAILSISTIWSTKAHSLKNLNKTNTSLCNNRCINKIKLLRIKTHRISSNLSPDQIFPSSRFLSNLLKHTISSSPIFLIPIIIIKPHSMVNSLKHNSIKRSTKLTHHYSYQHTLSLNLITAAKNSTGLISKSFKMIKELWRSSSISLMWMAHQLVKLHPRNQNNSIRITRISMIPNFSKNLSKINREWKVCKKTTATKVKGDLKVLIALAQMVQAVIQDGVPKRAVERVLIRWEIQQTQVHELLRRKILVTHHTTKTWLKVYILNKVMVRFS